ncbi:MAG: 50S ribosomal protein L11 methyltransferase [Paludibacteraceae bacterium]|nr:50S ribosomal protein L11 methyltransferase [Paludibacteraceae bacterium]
MKYSVTTIDCRGIAEWQTDLLMQALADRGFDSFEQDGETLRAYIPADTRCPKTAIEEIAARAGAKLVSIEACKDENWNAVWEASHEVEELPLGVKITPHCAFGAGHHETTGMMIEALVQSGRFAQRLNAVVTPFKRVLDMGTGTGVLAIMAAKAGALHVLAVDIDENSVNNARENALANGVEIEVRQGAVVPEGTYDLIMANIHRNILLEQLPDYARCTSKGGEVWLSGFYEADVAVLVEAAERAGLRHKETHENGEWRMIMLHKE